MSQLVRFEAAMLQLKAARAEFEAAFNFGPAWQEAQADIHRHGG
ncbi:hypothetical protein [Burkholderia sp. WP9]|nr:hypothetical protein [Burkholderia sp. WP9]